MFDSAGWRATMDLDVPGAIGDPVANPAFADLDALEATLVTRCQNRGADRHTIPAHTRFPWCS